MTITIRTANPEIDYGAAANLINPYQNEPITAHDILRLNSKSGTITL